MLDRPGWGLSDPIDYSRRDYGDQTGRVLESVLRALGVERANVVGASIGAIWALRLAQHRPAQVARVILLGGFPYPGWTPHRFLRMLASPFGALLVRLPVPAGAMRRQLRDIGHGPSLAAHRFPDEFFSWRVAFTRYTNSMRHEREMVRAVLERGRFKPGVALEPRELSAIERPVLMVLGSRDPVGSVEVWQEQLAALRGAALAVIDNAGHLPWWDNPDGVGAQLRDFLGA